MKDKTGLSRVDVNEQNLQSTGFYENLGFLKTERPEKDSSFRNCPIIHMSLP